MRRMLRVIEDIQAYVSNARKKHTFELGEIYINDTNIVYVLENTYAKYFNNAKEWIEGFDFGSSTAVAPFIDSKEKEEMQKYLPKIIKTFEVEDRMVMIIEKSADLILLRDVFDYYKGNMDPKAVAWIISSLFNIACFFETSSARISHNDISLDTYFISPEMHNGALLGGWWYANVLGDKMSAVPTRTYNLLPMSVKETRHSSRVINLDLIRATGRELLGDIKGDKLLSMNVAPEAMVNWLRLCSGDSAIREFRTWRTDIINASFGGRFFTPMDVRPVDIYK